MCGFLGIFHKGGFDEFKPTSLKTYEFLKNRGPNEESSVYLENCFLFHSRLFTLGREDFGHQPVVKGPKKLLFNGDIYNYEELGGGEKYFCDTDALFSHLEKKGMDALGDLNGSFACVYDDGEQIHFFRDRLGIRPLYYTILKNRGEPCLLVSTNLLPLAEMRNRYKNSLTLDSSYQTQYLALRYGAMGTPFEEIHSVLPGERISLAWESFKRGDISLKKSHYWSLEDIEQSEKEGDLDELGFLLQDAIKLRAKTGGHPFGTFLSGGIDSGLITAVAHKEEHFHKSYYLSMPGETNEDSRLERFLDHYSLSVNRLPYHYQGEEKEWMKTLEVPFGDTIIDPVNQLAKAASREVNVVLSGEGADEVFGGYVHHRLFAYAQIFNQFFPDLGREAILKLVHKLPLSFWNAFFPYNQGINKEGLDKFIKFLQSYSQPLKAYLALVSLSGDEVNEEILSQLGSSWTKGKGGNLQDLLRFDLKFWSPQYTLLKMDRIGFSHGLDIRVPFFDHRIVEWSMAHRTTYINYRQNKIPLRQAIKKFGLLKGELYDENKFPFRVAEKDRDVKGDNKISLIEGKRKTCQEHLDAWFKAIKELGIDYESDQS